MTDIERRFWSKVDKSGLCWLWTAFRHPKGYGSYSFRVDARQETWATHRFAWNLLVGAIPEGMHVLHHCDNPPCVNPDHLYVGTNLDNVRDRVRRGRSADVQGENDGMAKLKDADVRRIWSLCKQGVSQSRAARAHGIHKATVNDIMHRRTWRHITAVAV